MLAKEKRRGLKKLLQIKIFKYTAILILMGYYKRRTCR